MPFVTTSHCFVFNNDASHGFLTDDEGDEGDCDFLCEPKKESYQHFMRAEHSTFPSPSGVDGTRSFGSTGRVPNSTTSEGEQGISITPISMYSSCNSLFGMGFVHEDSQTLLDDMKICTFRLNPRLLHAVDYGCSFNRLPLHSTHRSLTPHLPIYIMLLVNHLLWSSQYAHHGNKRMWHLLYNESTCDSIDDIIFKRLARGANWIFEQRFIWS